MLVKDLKKILEVVDDDFDIRIKTQITGSQMGDYVGETSLISVEISDVELSLWQEPMGI